MRDAESSRVVAARLDYSTVPRGGLHSRDGSITDITLTKVRMVPGWRVQNITLSVKDKHQLHVLHAREEKNIGIVYVSDETEERYFS